MTVPELELPAPLDQATKTESGFTRGVRSITWTVLEPGAVHRNRYTSAWFEIRELRPWAREPLALWAQRRQPSDQWARSAFTSAAHAKLEVDIAAAVARYGFDRLWVELHRAGTHAAGAHDAVREAERHLTWRQLAATLTDMHVDGAIELIGLPAEDRPRVRTVRRHNGDSASAAVVARAVLDGDHIGWMTDTGRLVPLDDILQP